MLRQQDFPEDCSLCQVYGTLFRNDSPLFDSAGIFGNGSLYFGSYWDCCWKTADFRWCWNLVAGGHRAVGHRSLDARRR